MPRVYLINLKSFFLCLFLPLFFPSRVFKNSKDAADVIHLLHFLNIQKLRHPRVSWRPADSCPLSIVCHPYVVVSLRNAFSQNIITLFSRCLPLTGLFFNRVHNVTRKVLQYIYIQCEHDVKKEIIQLTKLEINYPRTVNCFQGYVNSLMCRSRG
jgi:hypothetical protein